MPAPRLLGVDPDLRTPGVAVAELAGGAWRISRATTIATPPIVRDPCPLGCHEARCAHAGDAERTALALALAVAILAELQPGQGDLLLCEAQFIPRLTGRSFDPAPILALTLLSGAIVAGAAAAGAQTLRVLPRTWRGTDPKPAIHCGVLACLSAEERALLPRAPRSGRYQGDALDAAGLVLYAAGRLGVFLADPATFAADVEPDKSPNARKRSASTAVQQAALPLWEPAA